MKSSILSAIVFATASAALLPVTCRAQFEIAPDHFQVNGVEPISETADTMAASGDQARRPIGNDRRGTHNASSAVLKASGKENSKGAGLRLDLLGFAIAIDACGSSVIRPSKLVGAVERSWKQARARLNYFSLAVVSMLPREGPQPISEWPQAPFS